MNSLIYFIRRLVFSNLFVSVCITLLTHQTYLLLKIPQENCFNVLAFVFLSTFFIYNFQRIYRLKRVDLLEKLIGIRLGWIIRNRKKIFFASILSGILSGYYILQLSFDLFLFSIPLALFSIFYVVPFLPKRKAIRDLPFAKIIVISLVWSLVIVVVPYVNYYGMKALNQTSYLFLLIEQFIFILAITLPFDVRDLRYDLQTHVRTIPSSIGVKNSIILSHTLLIVFLFLKGVQFYFFNEINLEQLIATIITTSITFFIIAFTSIRRGELFFSGIVDGTMILMYLGILLLEY